MDINNIALVRATNIIPFDGIVEPLSEVPYLRKNINSKFAQIIKDMLKRNNRVPQINFSKLNEDYMKQMSEKINEIAREYIPYTSDYNSMVLWALNGIVPDDCEAGFANNTFSNKSCAIIESLAHQIEKSKVVSLAPTDTAIKGSVQLSNQAIILINKNRYETLTESEKQKLSSLDLSVKIYEGDLSQIIKYELEKTGRYTPETLTLSREKNGYIESETSEELIDTINNIAKERNISQVLFFNIITQNNDEMEKLQSVKDEFENINIVQDFYQKEFYKYLAIKINLQESILLNLLEDPNVPIFIQQLCEKIEEFGIDNYMNIVSQYNRKLEKLREEGNLPTPTQIVESVNKGETIDLNELIETIEIETIDLPKSKTDEKLQVNMEEDKTR